LRLYVAGETPRGRAALKTLRDICETYLAQDYEIEVVDLKLAPERAKADQIVATPTLLRHRPRPERMVIGELFDWDRVVAGLGLQPIDTRARLPDGRPTP
jgi:circadian clock protein KaiB